MEKIKNTSKVLSLSRALKPVTDTAIIVHTSELFRRPLVGRVSPAALSDLKDYLASDLGEIYFRFDGQSFANLDAKANSNANSKARTNLVGSRDDKHLNYQAGSEKKQLVCIISGWFEVHDPITLQPVKFTCDIKTTLILVSSEADFPPLNEESDDEDYVLNEIEFDVLARVQEEILLSLPLNLPSNSSPKPSLIKSRVSKNSHGQALIAASELTLPIVKPSPFAKLAALKKSQ